jgi:hypothetical protein
MESTLEKLMIEQSIFTFHKRDLECMKKVELIIAVLRQRFNPARWVPSVHDRLFEKKVAQKIGRIRAQLLQRGTLVQDELGLHIRTIPDVYKEEGLHNFITVLDQLSEDLVIITLQRLLQKASHKTVVELLAQQCLKNLNG